MSEEQTTQAVAEVPSKKGGDPTSAKSFSNEMIVATWITFLIATIALYKVAWKPILAALEKREGDIKRSLEQAEHARKLAAEAETRRDQALAEADQKGREIVDAARRAAQELRESIERKAHDEAREMVAGARKEIEFSKEKAVAALRKESAELAIDLAGRILQENMDDARNRKLTDELLKDVK